MSKPIDLIVANTMHSIVDKDDIIAAVFKATKGDKKDLTKQLHEQVARQLLCSIAHDAAMKHVLAALLSTGAPHTLDLIAEGLQAVRDEQ